MTPTQIYLREDQARALERSARSSGRKKSDLIRDAIDRVYLGGGSPRALLVALRRSAGAWRRRDSGARLVERLRPGRLAARLRRDRS